jgi:hypothetical protein
MIELVRFTAEHALAIDPVAEQGRYKAYVTPAAAKVYEGPFSRTALLDGKPIVCAGLVNKWVDSWTAWAYIDVAAGAHMLAVTRAIRQAFPDLPHGRIEATTPIDYAAGRRWLELLGFKNETPDGMAHFTPDGRTYCLYAKVN